MLLRRTLPFALLVLAAAGCAQATPSVAITGVLKADQMCSVQVSNPRLLGGLWDVGAGGSYGIAVVVRNRMVVRMRAPGPLTIESDDFTLKGATVQLLSGGTPATNPAAFGAFGTYNVDGTGFIPAGTDTTANEGVGALDIIPNAVAADLAPTIAAGSIVDVRAHITPYGDSSGGNHIVLDPFDFPISICNGCLMCASALPTLACRPGADGEPYAGPAGCPP